ncbi:hypothetical protein [Kribbella sp. NPDC048928]
MPPTPETSETTESVARQIEAGDFVELFEDLSPTMGCHDSATQD